jgi:hypothetical protein
LSTRAIASSSARCRYGMTWTDHDEDHSVYTMEAHGGSTIGLTKRRAVRGVGQSTRDVIRDQVQPWPSRAPIRDARGSGSAREAEQLAPTCSATAARSDATASWPRSQRRRPGPRTGRKRRLASFARQQTQRPGEIIRCHSPIVGDRAARACL